MPFDLSSGEHIGENIRSFWNHWPINPDSRISGSDLVSNLALYIPLGWLVMVGCRLANIGIVFSMVFSVILCSLLSFFIEAVQIFSAFRIASAADWLLNTISGGIGAVIGSVRGRELWNRGLTWLKIAWRKHPVDIAALVLAGMLLADALVPYMPTILLKQVWRSLQRSHFDLFEGLAVHPWHWWLFTRVLVYAVLTVLLINWRGEKAGLVKGVRTVMVIACFAFCLEFAKLMIVSRSINIANLATSWTGCCLGVGICYWGPTKIEKRNKLELSIVLLLTYVFYLAWTPFDFSWSHERFQRVFSSHVQLLLFYHYAMGATLDHARLFVQSVLLQGLFVYLLKMRFGWFQSRCSGIACAACACGILGMLQEGGQLFLSTRTPSMTDIYCFALGGALGGWIESPDEHHAHS
jgi:VanZ family protein